jgi:mono/diheme cytochrome c family protein
MNLVRSTLLAAAIGVMSAASAQTASDGAALYAQHCAVCHLADGAGQAGLAPALKGEHWAKLGAERHYLATVLVHGLAGAIKVNGQNFVGVMTAFGGQFDDATLAALATQVRKLQGAADAKPYSADEIRAARDKPGNPQATRQLRAQIVAP